LKSGLGRIRGFGERRGVSTGPAGEWTYLHRRGLRIGAVALAALVFVFWGQPTGLVVILLVVILLVVILLVLLGLIELIGRPSHPVDYGGSLDTPGGRRRWFSDAARQPRPRRLTKGPQS